MMCQPSKYSILKLRFEGHGHGPRLLSHFIGSCTPVDFQTASNQCRISLRNEQRCSFYMQLIRNINSIGPRCFMRCIGTTFERGTILERSPINNQRRAPHLSSYIYSTSLTRARIFRSCFIYGELCANATIPRLRINNFMSLHSTARYVFFSVKNVDPRAYSERKKKRSTSDLAAR